VHSDNPYSGRLLKLAAGAEEAEQSLIGLQAPFGVTVDTAGDIYISENLDNGRVLKLTKGSHGVLSAVVTGLHKPAGVALDAAGTIYVAEMPPGADDQSRGRVLKLST